MLQKEEMMEIYSNYPVRKIVIEFLDGAVFANGRKFRDIDEAIQWVRDCEKIHRNPFSSRLP
ncbi:MAG: hypothetical protein ACMXX5_00110 [Candidatus Woesearchaeota archaeon]